MSEYSHHPLYEDRDEELCRYAAWCHENDPQAADGVQFICFNDIEAHKLKTIMEKRYPSVPIYFSYDFDTKTHAIKNYQAPRGYR